MATLTTLAALVPSATPAEPWDCAFSVACTTGESCVSQTRNGQIIAADHEGQLFFTGATGDLPVLRLSPRGDAPAAYAGTDQDRMAGVLTIRADNTATLTTHSLTGPTTAATYFGTCEVLN